MKMEHEFYFEQSRCIKCYACEIACKQWHDIDAGTFKLRQVMERDEGIFPTAKRTFFSLSCRHCTEAPCIAACSVNAIDQDEYGILKVNKDKCIGCRACLEACPFGIPQFDEKGILQICDMCSERLAQGKNPICSDSCPTRALQWGRRH
jgi:anaerobic dimethyl sulfoxide reductase subunit B